MIQIIGIKRITILLILLLINLGLGGGLYLYAVPEKGKLEKKLRTLRAQVSTVQSDINKMQIEFEQLDQQQERFDELSAKGLFSNQVRSDAKKLFSEIQDDSKVISTVVSVRPGRIMDNAEAMKANHKVLASLIEVDIEAFEDSTIYKYIELAKQRFPGHVSVDSILIERSQDVSAPILRSIASGSNPPLLKAEVLMTWRTIIPETQVLEQEGRL